MILPLKQCYTALAYSSPLKASSEKQEVQVLSEVLKAMRATGLVKPVSVSKYRLSMARRLIAYFLLIVCDGKFNGVPMEPQGWVKAERKHPLTLKCGCCTRVYMTQQRHIFGKICGALYVDRL